MKTFLGRLLLLAALCSVPMPGRAALYTVGAVVENFSLTDRATGKPVQLTDFAGKIVVLDWFAWWCPFCQAAAPQLLSGIDEWYAARGGQKYWFVAILIVNTLGILEIIYLIWFRPRSFELEVPPTASSSAA